MSLNSFRCLRTLANVPSRMQDRTKVTPESILATAQRIMAPYKIETPYVEWFTCYEIGQRICPKVTLDERVFIAGGELGPLLLLGDGG